MSQNERKRPKNENMANEQNLRPFTSAQSREEAVKNGRVGGIASGRARRLKGKHGRELVRALLSMPETDPRIVADMEALGLNVKDITNEVTMHARQIEKAKRKADTKAYNAVNKAAGYIEEAQTNVNPTINVTVSAEAARAASKWSTQED